MKLPKAHFHTVEPQRVCSYLPEQTASLEYRLYSTLSPGQVEHLLERGWRRFGMYLFRPACPDCCSCVPLRVNVNEFKPTKSQRKALKRNQHIRYTVHQPSVSEEHIQLYNSWHQDMTERSGWKLQQVNVHEYIEGFLTGDFESIHEIQYWDDKELIGVGLVDLLPHSLSSAYFYHAPKWRKLSPGTFSLQCEIEFAQSQNLKWLYLGYWIEGCQSMEYKNRFHPHEVLYALPDKESDPDWKTPVDHK